MGDYAKYVFIVALAAISVAAVIFGLLRGRGVPRKKLLRSVLLLGGAALICFGGGAVLAQFDMGWRCAPFNIMLLLCVVLFAIMLWRCMNVLGLLENANSALRGCGIISLGLVLVITLMWTALYFQLSSWRDKLYPYNGQMIVGANDMHGGSCAWHYYTHINSLVHGAEIAHDGSWWGPPPFQS